MTTPTTNDVLDQFRRADAELSQIDARLGAIAAATDAIGTHEQSLADIASTTAGVLDQLQALRSDATGVYANLATAVGNAEYLLTRLDALGHAVDPDQLVAGLTERLDRLQSGLTEQVDAVLTPIQMELTGIHRLAVDAAEALQYIDLSQITKDIDDRLERLEQQTALASSSRQRTEALLDWIERDQGLRPALDRVRAQERLLKVLVAMVAVTLIVAIVGVAGALA